MFHPTSSTSAWVLASKRKRAPNHHPAASTTLATTSAPLAPAAPALPPLPNPLELLALDLEFTHVLLPPPETRTTSATTYANAASASSGVALQQGLPAEEYPRQGRSPGPASVKARARRSKGGRSPATAPRRPQGTEASLATWLCVVDRRGKVVLKTHIAPELLPGSTAAVLARATAERGVPAGPRGRDDGGPGQGQGGREALPEARRSGDQHQQQEGSSLDEQRTPSGEQQWLALLPPCTRLVGGVRGPLQLPAPRLADVREQLLGLLRSGGCKVLVGHGLSKDLGALGIRLEPCSSIGNSSSASGGWGADGALGQPAATHRLLEPGCGGVRLYDTMSYSGFRGRGGAAKTLAALAAEHLDGRVIQAGAGGHDPEEDAVAVVDLYVRVVDLSYRTEYLTEQMVRRAQQRAAEMEEEGREEGRGD